MLKFSIMATELVADGDINDYGSTQKEEELLVGIPCAMMDHNHHLTSSSKHPSRPLWKTKKFVLGIIGVMAAVVVVASATLFLSVLRDFSSSGPARTGQLFLLQFYPYVTITNKTPYHVRDTARSYVLYLGCGEYSIAGGLAAGQTWTASSRGLCLVYRIYASLTLPDTHTPTSIISGQELHCTPYASTGTAYSIYSVIMKGDDACCVLSSHQTPQKCP